MKRVLLAGVALAMSVMAANADPFANMYGNTVTITGADGKSSKAFVNQDMTWQQQMADGAMLKGTYNWKDDSTACFTQLDPAPKPDSAPLCLKVESHNVGDTWTAKGSDGKVMTTYSLSAGR